MRYIRGLVPACLQGFIFKAVLTVAPARGTFPRWARFSRPQTLWAKIVVCTAPSGSDPTSNDTVSDPIPLKTKRTGNVLSAGGKLILHVAKNNNDVTLLADFAKYVCPVKEWALLYQVLLRCL